MIEENNHPKRNVVRPEESTERIEKGLTQDRVAPNQPDDELPVTQQRPVPVREGFTMDTIAPPPLDPPEDDTD